jgi:hypothetical protein
MLAAWYLVQISLLLIVQHSRYQPLLPIGWRICAIFTPTLEENYKYSANHS